MSLQRPMMFSKHLQKLPLDQVGPGLRGIGVESIDLTVRPGGHVAPERVEEDFPKVQQVLAESGVDIGMISTDIQDANDPVNQKVLRTAVKCGIKTYKIGYFKYDGFGTLRKRRDEVKRKLHELADLNRELGIHGGFHNHSGALVGASCWDVDYMLDGTDTPHIGVYFDPIHAVVEGGVGGWLQAMDLLSTRITMLGVKDFRWVDHLNLYKATRRNGWVLCTLDEGTTPWPDVIRYLQRINFNGPISFHPGYPGPKGLSDLDPPRALEQGKRDIALFRKWWDEATKDATSAPAA